MPCNTVMIGWGNCLSVKGHIVVSKSNEKYIVNIYNVNEWNRFYAPHGEYEKFCCVFSMIDGDVCIECGERDGKKLKASSRLKAFSQIALSIWGLIQVGKYHNKLSVLSEILSL